MSDATVEAARLGYVADADQGHEKYTGRIVVPYLTTTGPVKLRFRGLPGREGTAKYVDMTGNGPRLYNVQALADNPAGDTVYLCEGEFDTLIAQQIGLTAVGLPGVTSWQPHFRLVLEGYDKIRILGDHDDKPNEKTGKRPAEEMADAIIAEMKGHDVRSIMMPEGHDVNSAYLEGGKTELLNWINGTF